MAFSLYSSIESKLFSNSPSLLLRVKELVLNVGNLVSRGITVSAHNSSKRASPLWTYEVWSDTSIGHVTAFSPISPLHHPVSF